jgi:hypothetical protein
MNEQEYKLLKGILRKKSWQLLLAVIVGGLFIFIAPAYQRRLYNGYQVNMSYYWILVSLAGVVALILLALELNDYLKLLSDVITKKKYIYEKQITLLNKSNDQTWVLTLKPSGEEKEITELKLKTPEFETLQPAVGDTIRISTSFYTRTVLSMEIITVSPQEDQQEPKKP